MAADMKLLDLLLFQGSVAFFTVDWHLVSGRKYEVGPQIELNGPSQNRDSNDCIALGAVSIRMMHV